MVTVDSTVTIERAPADVFAFVSDPGNDPRWHHNILEARRTSDGPLGVGSTYEWDASFLGRRKVDVEVTRYEPDRLAETRLESGWMKATVTYVLEPADGGTRLTRRVAIPRPRVFRLFDPVIRWAGRRSGLEHVEPLRDVLEGRPAEHRHHHPHDA